MTRASEYLNFRLLILGRGRTIRYAGLAPSVSCDTKLLRVTINETFLVTGALGLVGSRLVPLLARQFPDSRIISVHRSGGNPSRSRDIRAEIVCGDLRQWSLWKALPTTITCVFHLAAVIPWSNSERQRAAVVGDNLLPLANLIEISQSWPDLKQVVFSSSVALYGATEELVTEDSLKKPTDLYGGCKLAGEDLLLCLQSYGTRVACLRYSSIYGFGQYPGSVLPTMVTGAITSGEIQVYGTGKRTQDFVHCDDTANANLLAYQKKAHGAFNIGSGIPTSMTELAETINHVFTNRTAKIIYKHDRSEDPPGIRIDISKAKHELGYSPIPLSLGLETLNVESDAL